VFLCIECHAFINLDRMYRIDESIKYSFINTSDKPQMNTTATTGISDAGAAPVGTNYNVCQPTSTAPVVHYVPAEAGTNLYCLVDRGTCM